MALYEVCYHLKMPVYKLSAEMPYEELLGWMDYFSRRPAGWREDDRTHKLMAVQGVKEKPWQVFPSLKAVYGECEAQGSSDGEILNANAFKGSAMFSKMLSATGGDKLEL